MTTVLPAFIHDEEIIRYLYSMAEQFSNEVNRPIQIIAAVEARVKHPTNHYLIVDQSTPVEGRLDTTSGGTCELAWADFKKQLSGADAAKRDKIEKMRAQAKDLLSKADALDAGTPQTPVMP